ncbi:uncharacterized protein LOC118647518 [Monomorium pharaonis]|uniref:uncharacterized protein LOC118647518 n=1 Tax=Monomorium pharaonis TaxID=307658 RepID=UPI001746D05B|nr:uncharacterized protein LOC118647518 [Monomorium pharaonis]
MRCTKASIPLLGIGGTPSGRTRGRVTVPLSSIHDSSITYDLHAYILPRVTFQLPTFEIPTSEWMHLQGIQLADPDFGRPNSIQIILGADAYGHIIKPDLIQGDPSSPIARSTIFVESYHCSIDHQLHQLLKKFWEQEELPPTKSTSLSPEEAECEAFFCSTHRCDENGRYVVRLPLKSPPTELGNSSAVAFSSLIRLRRRFDKDLPYQQLYTNFMLEYLELGHMEPVPHLEIDRHPAYYMPHHGVYREHSETTKLRVVFNGSSRSDNGVSVNDILYPKAKLQTDIFDVLLRFRQHQVVFSTDVVKMYRQIIIHEEDQDLQRIYWFDDHQTPHSYRLTTVTYGLNCAPFLALRVIEQLIIDEGHQFPKAVPALSKGRYVDDIFGGADSIEETMEIINQLTLLCTAGGFPLQKWNSNSQEILRRMAVTPNKDVPIIQSHSSRVKTLGLCWRPETDEFEFTSLPTPSCVITKRTVFSEIAQLYDPLGLLSPVVIRAKMLLQELWVAKIGWDDSLPPELETRWNSFRQDLPLLSQLKFPRWLHICSKAKAIELHGFSDASQLAMAAVVYVKVSSETEETSLSLICAKTKVAPLKRMTIPRLDLTAAVMVSRLLLKVQRTLNLTDCPTYLWTDSAVTLAWITTHPSRWKEFVRNRTTVIQEITPSTTWRFVPGKDNPADCASRGINSAQLKHHPLWWSGPAWLRRDPHHWPNVNAPPTPHLEQEKRPRHAMATTKAAVPTCWELLARYFSLPKLLRVTALVQKAAERFRFSHSPTLDSPLTPPELRRSRQFWTRLVQRAYFPEEIGLLSTGKYLPRSNPLIRLTPILDSDGLLRVGGRLENSPLDPESKHPYIIPRHSLLTTLIIADSHAQTLHGGTQLTSAHIRQTYWIVGGRAPVRSHILRCVRCARHRKQRAQQLMGQLPTARVTPARAFLNAGVDYAGPIIIKTWRGRAARTYKGYLAIFVCFATSAVHLKVVTEYSTEAFMAAYKRFCSRRGICATLHSDCGTNFVGADAELRKLFNSASQELKDLASLLADCGTEWKFIPPATPHFGGIWEAAVKSTKFHLRRIIGDSLLTYEELSTLMSQIEAVLNSSPISPMSDDSEDLSILTPGHFLIGDAIHTIPEPNLIEESSSRLSRWQLIRQKMELFWKRWTTECLQCYQAISKWHHPSNELREDSLVLLLDERYPPTKWPLARVVKLHPGQDGLTRVVTVRTSTSTLKRPVTKVCILPVEPKNRIFGNKVPEGGRENVLG